MQDFFHQHYHQLSYIILYIKIKPNKCIAAVPSTAVLNVAINVWCSQQLASFLFGPSDSSGSSWSVPSVVASSMPPATYPFQPRTIQTFRWTLLHWGVSHQSFGQKITTTFPDKALSLSLCWVWLIACDIHASSCKLHKRMHEHLDINKFSHTASTCNYIPFVWTATVQICI